MIESYRIGVNMVLGPALGGELAGIIAQFEALDRLLSSVKQKMSGLPGTMNADISALAAGLDKSAAASERVARAMPDVARQAQATAEAMERAASASTALVPYVSQGTGFSLQGNPYTPYGYVPPARPTVLPQGSDSQMVPYQPPTGFTMGPGGPAIPSGGNYRGVAPYTPWSGYAGGPGPHTAYGGPGGMVAPGGGGGAGGGGPIPFYPNGYPSQPSSSQFAVAAAGYGLAGHALTGFVGDVYHAGQDVGQELYKLRAAGWTDEQANASLELAKQMQRSVPGTTVSGALHAQLDMATLFRSPETGKPETDTISKELPDLLRMATVLSAYGKGGEMASMFQTLQLGEMRGILNNPQQLHALMYALEETTIRSGGRVGPAETLQTVRSAGAAGFGLPLDELMTYLVPLIISQNAGRAGSGLRGFYQQFQAGRESDAAVDMLISMDLVQNPETHTPFERKYYTVGPDGKQHPVEDPGLKRYKKGIGQYQLPADAMVGFDMLSQGRDFEYIDKTLLPAIQKYNMKEYGRNDVNLEGITGVALSSRIPAGNMLADIFRLWPMIRSYQTSFKQSQTMAGPDGSGMAAEFNLRLAQDPALKMQAFNAAWNGFLTSLANGPVMDAAIKTLQGLTNTLNTLAKAADDHPVVTSGVMGTAAVAGGAAVAGASVAGAMWLGKPMLDVAKWLGSRTGVTAAARAGAGALGATSGSWLPPVLMGMLAWDAPEALGAGNDWWGSKYGWSPMHPLSMSSWNKEDGKYEYDWEHGHGAPTAGSGPVTMTGTVMLDGRAVGQFIADQQADHMEGGQTGPTSPDLKMTLPFPGWGGGY